MTASPAHFRWANQGCEPATLKTKGKEKQHELVLMHGRADPDEDMLDRELVKDQDPVGGQVPVIR